MLFNIAPEPIILLAGGILLLFPEAATFRRCGDSIHSYIFSGGDKDFGPDGIFAGHNRKGEYKNHIAI